MNREDIIRMARECGAYPAANVDGALLFWSESQVEHFAALVASAERTWIGLTLDDVPDIYLGDLAFGHGVKWAEAKLKELNT